MSSKTLDKIVIFGLGAVCGITADALTSENDGNVGNTALDALAATGGWGLAQYILRKKPAVDAKEHLSILESCAFFSAGNLVDQALYYIRRVYL